jgi:uncharacterized damage-inducible protein DinB
MDLLDRLLQHDAWTTRQLLLLARPLTDPQLDHDFDIAHRTVRNTFLHIIRNMELWTDLMSAHPVRPNPSNDPQARSFEGLITRLDRAAADFATLARSVANQNAWDDRFLDTLDDPPRPKTFGGAIAHLLTHSMHHRAQLLYMLRRLNLQNLPEGDVLSWEHQLPPKRGQDS